MITLGIHNGHDASASLVVDGELVFSYAEERHVRIKHYGGFPFHAIAKCHEFIANRHIDNVAITGSFDSNDLDWIGSLVDPSFTLKSKRTLSFKSKIKSALKSLSRHQINVPLYLNLPKVCETTSSVVHVKHHLAHASSAYFTSGLTSEEVIALTLDGSGEDNVCMSYEPLRPGDTIGSNVTYVPTKRTNKLTNSLGFFYSAVTEALGWHVNDGEGTLMGLAPYGSPSPECIADLRKFCPSFESLEHIVAAKTGDTSLVKINECFYFSLEESASIKNLLNNYTREDIAASAQKLLEIEVVNIFSYLYERFKIDKFVCAGGIFLNVKVNQVVRQLPFVKELYVFGDAGDSGLSSGAALYADALNRSTISKSRLVKTLKLGPEYSDEYIKDLLQMRKIAFIESSDIARDIANYIKEGFIVGWFQGKEEVGPRALGGRSILFDPSESKNKDIINSRVKYRQAFRPFCPSLQIEYAHEFLEDSHLIERYMICAYKVKSHKIHSIPAVVHCDGTCRPQMVEKDVDTLFWSLLDHLRSLGHSGVVMNTSFNIKGEPIVSTPRDALKCFYDTGIDVLALGSYIIKKENLTN